MRPKNFVVFFVILMLTGFVHAQEGKRVLLKYAYPPGKKVTYKHTEKLLFTGGIPIEMTSDHKSIEWLTESHEDGSFTVAAELSDVNESTLISSRLIQRESLGLLAQKEFGFNLTPTGILTNFVPPSLEDINASEQDAAQMTITNLELGYASLFELPEYPVQVGDSWTSEREYKVNYDIGEGIEGSTFLSSTHRIKKATKKDGFQCFEIEERSQINMRVYMNLGKMSFIRAGTGTVKGKWFFDYERGLVQKYEAKTNMDVLMTRVDVPEAEPSEETFTSWTKRDLEKVE